MRSQLFQGVELGIEDGAGQDAFVEVAQTAAGLGLAVEESADVALAEQVIGGSETDGSGADDGDGLPGGRLARGQILPGGTEAGIGDEPFEVADGGGATAAAAAATATVLAGGMAESPEDGWERERLAKRAQGVVEVAGFDLPDHARDVEIERADPMAGREAIADMIAQEQFEGGAAQIADLGGFAFDDHAGFGFGRAGGDDAGASVLSDLDDADEAGGHGPALFEVTEGGDIDAELAGGVEQRGALGDFDRLTIDDDRRHQWISMAWWGQTRMQVSQRVQSSWLMVWRW